MDIQEKREFALGAKEILDNKAFQQAILRLRQVWFGEFLDSQGEVTAAVWRAKLQALESIPTELNLLINDYKKAIHDAS
jgi:hypothetical protein